MVGGEIDVKLSHQQEGRTAGNGGKTARNRKRGEKVMNGYIGFYKEKKVEVRADTSFEAQKKIADMLKVKKAYQITVVLCELDDKQVVHSPTF